MKLEVVDKRNPILIRVATVMDTDDHRIKVIYPPTPITITFKQEALYIVQSCKPYGNSLDYAMCPKLSLFASVQGGKHIPQVQ